MNDLTKTLEPIAAWFRSLGTPEPVVHWGHPVMMALVVFVMGSFVGLAGWRGRVLAGVNREEALHNKAEHRKLPSLMYFS